MRVGRADHAELVGIDAQLLLELEAVLERRARVFELQHLGLLELGQVEIALVPALEIGELVVGRQEGVGLAVALDLRRFVEALPLGAGLGIFAVDRLAGERLDDRKHAAVGEIAVVGDGEHVAAGLVLVGCHPFPQVARIVAARRQARCRARPGCALSPLSRKMTLRWRLLPPVFEVHSKPMNAVKRPGSFASSAALMVSSQAER